MALYWFWIVDCLILKLNFFFFYGSTYTYLSVMRVANLASAADLTVRWRPFNVRQIMIETNNIPFAGKPAKAAYMWRDIARRAAGHRVAFPKPPVYPVDPDLVANLVGVVAAGGVADDVGVGPAPVLSHGRVAERGSTNEPLRRLERGDGDVHR